MKQDFGLSRHHLLKTGFLSSLALSAGGVRVHAAQKWFDSIEGSAKSVIHIHMPGGVAAQESWNPKPESPAEYRGPYGYHKTKIPGIILSETLPNIAKVADKLCVIRSVVGLAPDHGLATSHMLTGQKPSPALKYPSIGSIVNHEFGSRNSIPGYVCLGTPGGAMKTTGYLSSKYGPFSTGTAPSETGYRVNNLDLPQGVDLNTYRERLNFRDMINAQFKKMEGDKAIMDTLDSNYRQALSLVTSQDIKEAFVLEKESQKLKESYGIGVSREHTQAGASMMTARRLVEAGARFVSLKYGTWDDHQNLKMSFDKQMPGFDQAFAALIKDLDERGLLDNTLVWVSTEFGRTPKFNTAAGRDHWARVFPIAMAGGGLKRGLFYGDSDATSSDPSRNPVLLHDLHSTIYKLIGINSQKELMAPGERPIEIVDHGKPVDDLIA